MNMSRLERYKAQMNFFSQTLTRMALALTLVLATIAGLCLYFLKTSGEPLTSVEPFDVKWSDSSADLEPRIQRALDWAHAEGGGTVRLGPGIFGITRPLILRSGVHLVGTGIGATTIRPLTDDLVDKVIDDTGVWASIGIVAADGASIRDLTLDHQTNATRDNGIAILPAGPNFEGKPSSNVIIERVEILGATTRHSYLIWNFRGSRIKIINNFVNGGTPGLSVDSHQEGIESYGGNDVLISGNSIRNVANACINVGSAGGLDTAVRGIIISGNHTENCRVALNVGTAFDERYGPQNTSSVLIVGNVFRKSHEVGVLAVTAPNTANDDIRISGNSIYETGSAGDGGVGVMVRGVPGEKGRSPGHVQIDGNSVFGTLGHNGHGVRVIHHNNVSVTNNVIKGAAHTGIFAIGSEALFISGNRISDVGFQAISLHAQSNESVIANNFYHDWGQRTATTPIIVDGSEHAVLVGNTTNIQSDDEK